MSDARIGGVSQMAEKNTGRIIYVEPNDVYDSALNDDQRQVLNGNSITPKYEDFCISFNLIVEKFSRFKNQGERDANTRDGRRTFSIEWTVKPDELRKGQQSFLAGGLNVPPNKDDYKKNEEELLADNNAKSYLTTYYTDITFDSYQKRTEIEGLGVEQVQISYESWYTPTIVIKFVDVRGSALFEREEAIHVDEKLNCDNIFGAFFTQPYPLFRLQVKGFLGRPVTYQLTCSGFDAQYNSTTGNFEATAKFIGYTWSLLTDIPFTYLMAAPNCTYLGRDYWNRHVNDREWALEGGTNSSSLIPPIKLNELFRRIKRSKATIKDFNTAANAQEQEALNIIEQKAKLLEEISIYLGKFRSGLIGDFNSENCITLIDNSEKVENKEQLLVFSGSGNNIVISKNTQNIYDDLYKSVNDYATSYPGSPVNTDKLPNKWISCPSTITPSEIFSVKVNNDSLVTSLSLKNNSDASLQTLKNLQINDHKLNDKSIKYIYNEIQKSGTEKCINAAFKNFVYLIDFYNLENSISVIKKSFKDEQEKIVRTINDRINVQIEQIVGFKPYIKNIFKIMFCHLETFCHIMFDSANEIYDQMARGLRDPSYLGIDIKSTDIPSSAQQDVVPWPAVYDKEKTNTTQAYQESYKNVYAWIGDFSHNFIEEKVVYGFQEGVQEITEEREQPKTETVSTVFPILPTDYFLNHGVFNNVSIDNPSDLAGFLSLRAANILGIMCGNNVSNDEASLFGRLDAYNLYVSMETKENLESKVAKQLSGFKTNESSILNGISHCDINYKNFAPNNKENTNDRFQSFETEGSLRQEFAVNGHHTMFKSGANSEYFTHWYGDSDITYIPSGLQTFTTYTNSFKYVESQKSPQYGCFKLNFQNELDYIASDWLHVANLDKIKQDFSIGISPEEEENFRKKYTNYNMFRVVTDDPSIGFVNSVYDKFKNKETKIYDYEVKDDLTNFSKRFLKVSNEDKSRFFMGCNIMLSPNLEKSGLSKDKFLLFNTTAEQLPSFNYKEWNDTKSNITVNKNYELKYKDETVTNETVVIRDLKIYNLTDGKQYDGDLNGSCSLFGCPFYYLQNDYINNTEDTSNYFDRVYKVKSLLLLHSFKYNYIKCKPSIFTDSKKNGSIEYIPRAYALLLGGLLWRKRYYEKNGIDPVRFSNNTTQYKAANIDDTLFIESGNSLYFSCIANGNANLSYYPIYKLFGFNSPERLNKLDYNVKNQLIQLFEDYSKSDLAWIADDYEFKHLQSNEYNTVYVLKTNIVQTETTPPLITEEQYDELQDGEKEKYIKSNDVNKIYSVEDFKKDLDIVNSFFDNAGKTISYNVSLNNTTTVKTTVADSTGFLAYLNTGSLYNYKNHYISIIPSNNKEGLCLLMDENDTSTQAKIKQLYSKGFLFVDNCYRNILSESTNLDVTEEDKIKVKYNLLSSYFNGFIDAIKNITVKETTPSDANSVASENNDKKETPEAQKANANPNSSRKTYENEDLSIGIYYYLKNVWDRWLVPNAKEDNLEKIYNVGEFFKKNFIFIDSFYRDIGNKLAINLDEFYNAYYNASPDVTLYSVIGYIVQKHQCLFVGVPDYIGFGNNDRKLDEEKMRDLFRPLPYNKIPEPSYNNKFVTIYTHELASKTVDGGEFVNDTYDIMSHGEVTDEALSIFSDNQAVRNGINDISSLYGYNVPSFGVAFNRQNNHIFKNINVNMGNPMATEQSIYSNYRIMLKGQTSGRTVCFIGQDTFNIFSNYSYSCEVEMLGDAQICPLMYFQLLNVPMWRGTYMIYKVTHIMTPGNMTTKFTGVKMSKFAKPWNQHFFTVLTLPDQGSNGSGDGASTVCADETLPYDTNANYGTPGMFSDKKTPEKLRMCGITSLSMGPQEAKSRGLIQPVTFNQSGGTKTLEMNVNIAADFKAICDEILKLGWFKLNVGNSYRDKNSVNHGVSRHCWGLAVDINPGSGGNPWFAARIPRDAPEPDKGSSPPYYMKKCRYNGPYDPSRCIWHWGHPVVQIFLKHGWGWGGAYGDVMHFSIDGQ